MNPNYGVIIVVVVIVEIMQEDAPEKLISEAKLSKSEADEQAKKLIGATWDVGHINMMKQMILMKNLLWKKIINS